MGLLLDKLKQIELGNNTTKNRTYSKQLINDKNKLNFNSSIDLNAIPPELSLQILKYLNATDLCLASCVWSSLANDNTLWKSLCQTTWGYASVYKCNKSFNDKNRSYRSIFMHLDEATLTFNANGWKKVI